MNGSDYWICQHDEVNLLLVYTRQSEVNTQTVIPSLIINKQMMIKPQTAVDGGLLTASIMLYPPQVKHVGLANGSWRRSVNASCVLCRCGALVSMACINH